MSDSNPRCQPDDHPPVRARFGHGAAALERAARLFRAMSEGPRLRILELLAGRECCVTEVVAELGDKFSTVSQRLRVLRAEGVVTRRRQGTHLFYALADRHVADLLQNALAHADELEAAAAGNPSIGVTTMATTHANHAHQHGPDCGHTPVKHDGHVDYLHDGCLHHVNGGVVEEHKLAVNAANPAACTPSHDCGAHDQTHQHGPGCGHEAVPHGDHVDYLVDGHLHHPHGNHCDDHGALPKACRTSAARRRSICPPGGQGRS